MTEVWTPLTYVIASPTPNYDPTRPPFAQANPIQSPRLDKISLEDDEVDTSAEIEGEDVGMSGPDAALDGK